MLIKSLMLVSALTFGQEPDPAAPTPPSQAEVAPEVAFLPIPEVASGELILGEANAPVTLVVYTSMVCIQCAAWHADVLPQLIEQEIATGRVRLVLRQLPIAPVQVSSIAAGIIRCAVQDNQMNVAGALFANLEAFREEQILDLDWYLTGIAASGRTREEVETCLADPSTLSDIQEGANAARAAGVARVPAVFVNGKAVAVATAADISQAVELALPVPVAN